MSGRVGCSTTFSAGSPFARCRSQYGRFPLCCAVARHLHGTQHPSLAEYTVAQHHSRPRFCRTFRRSLRGPLGGGRRAAGGFAAGGLPPPLAMGSLLRPWGRRPSSRGAAPRRGPPGKPPTPGGFAAPPRFII